jgi:hypothetical protein
MNIHMYLPTFVSKKSTSVFFKMKQTVQSDCRLDVFVYFHTASTLGRQLGTNGPFILTQLQLSHCLYLCY